MANSLSATRPSLFRPTSMTALSFSIAVMVPLTTRPSKPPLAAPPSDSSSSAAKSSRVGLVAIIRASCIYVPGQAVVSAGLSSTNRPMRAVGQKGPNRPRRRMRTKASLPAKARADRRRLGGWAGKGKENGGRRASGMTVLANCLGPYLPLGVKAAYTWTNRNNLI